ncbi:uncharacterized protein LOC125648722 [Ostrea edulis]|uniref:uncharacterized protein LOC125648722 n=1 Tax=Ostrea edulis TaxID=37623 RepID=UPI0024AF8400|nr:uncharacterized protein LOC125648722 [Ostrea edulis]
MAIARAILLVYLVSTISAVKWPRGTYTLMKPDTGCPAGWLEGWRLQDGENDHNLNSIDTAHHFYGIYGNQPRDFRFSFCTKDAHDFNADGLWPAGNYCIMRQGHTCPSGFNYGTITWDDENTNNMNRRSGILPSGDYGRDTTIHYCCRSDGYWMNYIKLPNTQPFFLIRYTSICQTVEGMLTKEVGVNYGDEKTYNRDSSSGAHPFRLHLHGNTNFLIYCYYYI